MKHFAIFVLTMSLPTVGAALDFTFDNGIEVAVDTTATYGIQWRVQSRDSKLSADAFLDALQEDPFLPLSDPRYTSRQTQIINSDDGNNNFDTGLISNRLTLLMDIDARWRDFGVFLRGRAFYDTVYKDAETDLDLSGFRTYNSGTLYGGDAGIGQFPAGTRDDHGAQVEFLDAFAFGLFELPGDRLLDIRAGRQVVNWGEAVFYQGVNSIQNRVDAQAANTPGVEIKEIFLPTGTLYGQLDLLPNLSLEAYLQYEWIENDLNGVGSYFSTNDATGPGANAFLIPSPGLPFIPEEIRGNEFNLRGVMRAPDREASDSGQWGVAFHYVTDNNTDIGFYHVVGHDKKPSLEFQYQEIFGNRIPTSYRQVYVEDIRGSAISFTTVVGETNITGELSLLDGTPMVNADGDAEEEKLLKLQVGGTHVLGPSAFWDDVTLSFEGFYANVTSAAERDLIADDYAYGYSVFSTLGYKNVFPGWDFEVPIFFKHDVSGVIQELQSFSGAKVLSVGIGGFYLNNFRIGVTYSSYFGGDRKNFLRDRDNVAVTLKYSF